MNPFSNKKLKSLLYVTIGGYCSYAVICLYKGEPNFYKNYVMPVVHLLSPEDAHNLAVQVSRNRLYPKSSYTDPHELNVNVFNKNFSNPIGIAAGFDKDGKAVLGLKDIGFGFVEIGSITPEPQPGNDKPRVFRLSNDLAVINRYGFNSEGHNVVLERIQSLREKYKDVGIIGINLGKNKTSPDSVADYVKGIEKFGPVADYLVINISSPNTPNLRDLQHQNQLRELLSAVVKTRDNLPLKNKPPLLLKLAPDLTYSERVQIAKVISKKDCKVDGLIICNTTIERPDSLTSEEKSEVGGLSGQPLKSISTRMIGDMYRLTNGMPIIGVGGVSTGKDVLEKIEAGAILVQIYTSMIYEGPPIVTKIKSELVELLKERGYKDVADAVGQDL